MQLLRLKLNGELVQIFELLALFDDLLLVVTVHGLHLLDLSLDVGELLSEVAHHCFGRYQHVLVLDAEVH